MKYIKKSNTVASEKMVTTKPIGFMKKERSISYKDFLQITRPTYVYLKIIPDKTARNSNSDLLGQMVTHMYRTINERCKLAERHFNIEMPVKCAYFVEIEKNVANFYLIIPQQFLAIAKEKISYLWPHASIEEVPGITQFDMKKTSAYSLQYKKKDALSLSTNMKNSSLVNTMLNVIDVLDEGDRIGVFYNFVPTQQTAWRHEYKRTIEQHKKNASLDKNTLSPAYVIKTGFLGLLDIIQDCIDSATSMFTPDTNFSIATQLKESLEMNVTKQLSSATIKKGSSEILTTQIAILSTSEISAVKSDMNAISVCQSFHAIADDNTLQYKRVKSPKFNPEQLYLTGFDKLNCSVPETYNFFQLPNRETLQKHNIQHISILENPIPSDLSQGYIHIGDAIYKSCINPAYMSSDKNLANLGLVVLGPQGAGKSKLFANIGANVSGVGENLVVLDFIKKCELSDEIASVTPKDKLVIIDLSKFEDLQAFGFNEVRHMGFETADQRLDAAQRQTQCTISFINAINIDTEMTARMRRCLVAACNIVYIHPGTSLRDVVDCLQNHEERHRYIDMIPEEMENDLKDDVYNLLDMDDKDNKGVVNGTKVNKLDFLMDRINLLLEDRRLKHMFNKSIEDNLDFVDLLNQGKTILIKMPEATYPSKFQKNILVTYFISKLWLTAQIRGDLFDKPLRTHIILDEIFQAPTCYKLLEDILLQARKFQFKFVFSAHFLNKLGTLKEVLKASGSSYMFLQGTDKANFVEMAEDLVPYTVDDMLSLKPFHALCYIRCETGFAKFIVKMPPPIS